jgi:uncharacterized protein DUF4145
MRNSWWELGEGMGLQGDTLALWRIGCAFCGEKGNFKLAFHGEKKKPNENKKLNFDVYRCENCAGYVHVLWSASEHGYGMHRLYDYQVLPWPLTGKPEPSENWPKGVHRFWVQAHNSLANENWDASSVMSRSALQFIMRHQGAKKGNLKQEIKDLASKGILQPVIEEWSHEVRELANDSAHPEIPDAGKGSAKPAEDLAGPDPQDAKDIVNFLDFLLFYLYDLPEQIKAYRKRKEPANVSA